MDFSIRQKPNPNVQYYGNGDLDLAYEFTKCLYKEFEPFLKSVILFGGTARKEPSEKGDVDILVIVDDTSIYLNQELTEAYRIIAQKAIADVSERLHVTTLRLTSFWEYVRAGDPIAINILRDGVALLDTGFFDPLRALLKQGRIRPTEESMRAYYNKAPITLRNSKGHILQATLDLYWAVVDSAHAAMIKNKEIPPSPRHLPEMMYDKLVKSGKLEKKYAKDMRDFYNLMKKITHRDIKEISGKQFDNYYKRAEEFVKRMEKIIEEKE